MPKSNKTRLVKTNKTRKGGKLQQKKQKKQNKRTRKNAVLRNAQPQYAQPVQQPQPQNVQQPVQQQVQIEHQGPAFGKLRDVPANMANAAALGFGADVGIHLGEKAIDGIFGDE
jgi:hypothetical protein